MPSAVTSNNYIGHYTSWCLRNAFAPLRYDILYDIFYGCITNEDFKLTLNALYEIQDLAFRLSIMTSKSLNNNNLESLTARLKLRYELFKRVPSGTNLLLAYNLIEEITLKIYSSGESTMQDKDIERFDKLKNLALSTKYIAERRLAFEKSLETFTKLTQVKLTL